MSWWPPWRRRSDEAAKEEVAQAQERLEESEQLRRRADEAGHRLKGHLRRNRFGQMIDREVFGGRG
jgi:hypothetical protein